MTQEELLVSPETFKTLKMVIDKFMEDSYKVGFPKQRENVLGLMNGNHKIIIKQKPTLKEGSFYINTEPNHDKMIFVVVDPEKSICSGWDAKGKFFSKEWIFIGSRYQLVENYKVRGILAENGYDFLTLKQSYLSEQYNFEAPSKTILPIFDIDENYDDENG